jgi:hypothetical protein
LEITSSIGSLYLDIEPSSNVPLVIVFDEFDIALTEIHKGIEPHKNIPISVQDKAGWNHMLDEINIGMYPNLILILTSNKSPEFIKDMDPSYIREGRINLTFEMIDKIE